MISPSDPMPDHAPFTPEEAHLPFSEWWPLHVQRAFDIGNTQAALREVWERWQSTLSACEAARAEAVWMLRAIAEGLRPCTVVGPVGTRYDKEAVLDRIHKFCKQHEEAPDA